MLTTILIVIAFAVGVLAGAVHPRLNRWGTRVHASFRARWDRLRIHRFD